MFAFQHKILCISRLNKTLPFVHRWFSRTCVLFAGFWRLPNPLPGFVNDHATHETIHHVSSRERKLLLSNPHSHFQLSPSHFGAFYFPLHILAAQISVGTPVFLLVLDFLHSFLTAFFVSVFCSLYHNEVMDTSSFDWNSDTYVRKIPFKYKYKPEHVRLKWTEVYCKFWLGFKTGLMHETDYQKIAEVWEFLVQWDNNLWWFLSRINSPLYVTLGAVFNHYGETIDRPK